MRTSEILIAAKARLTPETWGQGEGGKAFHVAGKSCANQAIVKAIWLKYPLEFGINYDDPRWDTMFGPAARLLASVATGHGVAGSTPRWNDTPGRTLQEVHDAFSAAIAIAQQQEAAQEAVSEPVAVLR